MLSTLRVVYWILKFAKQQDNIQALILFADNKGPTVTARTESTSPSMTRDSLSRIEKWTKVNYQKLNYKKSHWIIFSVSTNYYLWLKELNVGSCRIECLPSVK